MADAGAIFYSNVDINLQEELNARGNAGKRRHTNDLNYMLGKVANVELTAYSNAKSKENNKEKIHSLGGSELTGSAYLPSSFLKKRTLTKSDGTVIIDNTYKIPPFISSCDISMSDHTMGLLNSATVTIVIPNPDIDLDFMEGLYARPGRAVTLKIAHPKSALIINNNKLTDATIQPAIVPNNTNNTLLTETVFDGLIISFDMSYGTDATVTLTVHLRGTSNVYTDVSMLSNPEKSKKEKPVDSKEASEKQINEFYNAINAEIESNLKWEPKEKNIQILHKHDINDPTLNSLAFGINDSYYFRSNQFWDEVERRYIQLGQLIRFINKYILTKQESVSKQASILCNDDFCFSTYYEKLISADPENILIISNDVYGKDKDVKDDRHFISRATAWKSALTNTNLWDVKFNAQNNTHSFPSRMFINLNLIKSILDELQKDATTYKLNDFLAKLNTYIVSATGGAIDMQLVTHPVNPEYLLFYDKNYLGNKPDVVPYSVPMMANHPHGSIVKDFKISAKLPASMQGLMYTTNNSDNISEEQIAPYMNFMYNNAAIKRDGTVETLINADGEEIKKKLEERYRASYELYVKTLDSASQEFGNTKQNESKQKELQSALTKYIQYPSPTIEKSSQMQSPIYPYEVEFTIDGINGFRYGDAVKFEALPKKYQKDTIFSIISINHTVNTNGEWDTKLRCIMRPSFTAKK